MGGVRHVASTGSISSLASGVSDLSLQGGEGSDAAEAEHQQRSGRAKSRGNESLMYVYPSAPTYTGVNPASGMGVSAYVQPFRSACVLVFCLKRKRAMRLCIMYSMFREPTYTSRMSVGALFYACCC